LITAVFLPRVCRPAVFSGHTGCTALRSRRTRLTNTQRTSVLAQTEIRSGYPLDATRTRHASWERLNLAAAMSATVRVNHNGSVAVLSTGGQPKVVKA
jgi:hypothetical protein